MFDKAKTYNNLRKAQGEMKKKLESIFAEYKSPKINILMRGDKRIEKIDLDGVERKDLKDALNDLMKDVDKKSEKKMRGDLSSLGLNLP